jgi:hypothetical protein
MDHLDTVNLQLIAAMGELRMAAVCLPTDAEKAEPIRRHLLAAEKRVIEAHKAASAAATEHRPPVRSSSESPTASTRQRLKLHPRQTRRGRRLSLRAMRTLALLLSVFLSACATAAVAGGARTYPPSPSSSDLDAYGTARDPEIARCMSRQQMRSNFGESLFGPSVVPENKSYEYQVCWCKAHGFRGMGAGGACLD